MEKRQLSWMLGYSGTMESEPEEWIPAHVPGGAQKDYGEAHGYPDYLLSVNYEKYRWMEDVFWKYEAELDFALEADEKAYLRFYGIDYRFKIWVDDEVLADAEGMYSHLCFDVSRFAGGKHTLRVNIYPVPKATDVDDRTQARMSAKSAACYSWDWHPRLVTSGIWDEAFLEIVPAFNVTEYDLSYRLSEDLKEAEIRVNARTSANGEVRFSITDPEGNTVYEEAGRAVRGIYRTDVKLAGIELWYPTGYGKQPVYKAKIETLDEDGNVLCESCRKIGFKRTQLLMNEGSWDEPAVFPKSRSDAPACLAVNGQRIFARGSNIVCTRIFPGEMTEEIYDRLLTLVKEANMNILRIWGGGFINKESFYDLCDEKGIMIWQEFPLACNEYPDDRHYLAVLGREAESIVRRLRTHPCMAFWCGGNELFNVWSKMTDQHHALRLLDTVTFLEDRDTPFIMTSPLNGMAHGCYSNYDAQTHQESMQMFAASGNTAYTEFGCGAVSDMETLKKITTEEEFAVLKPGDPVWIAHHNFDGWRPENGQFADVEYFYGGYRDIADLSEKTQFLQAMCYRSNFEEMRRQWPHCAMALNWCFNEAWPMICSLSIVSYPDRPRPSYYSIRQALRSRIASLKVAKQRWFAGEEFTAEVYLINDTLEVLPGGTVHAYIEKNGEKVCLGDFHFADVKPQDVVKLGAVSDILESAADGKLKVSLTVDGHEEMDSSYEYVLREAEKGYVKGTFLND